MLGYLHNDKDARKMSANNNDKAVISHKRACSDVPSIKQALIDALTYSVGKDNLTATERDWFNTTAYVVRDQMIDRWMQSMPLHIVLNPQVGLLGAAVRARKDE